MAKWEGFRPCSGCGWDFATGEGQPGCHYYDCPYLPEELNVHCASCRFDFFTMEGNPPCDDPMTCPHGEEPRARVENVRRWRELAGMG